MIAKFFEKIEKSEKIEFLEILIDFLSKFAQKSINLNNFWDLVTRRAGCLSWTRRVIRCQGKSSRRGLATFWDLLRRNVNFWLSSIRSNFDFILFPGITFWDGESELGPEILYRLFSGWKFEKLTAKFFGKIEKSEKIDFSKFW